MFHSLTSYVSAAMIIVNFTQQARIYTLTLPSLALPRITFIMHTSDTCFDSFHVNYWCEIV